MKKVFLLIMAVVVALVVIDTVFNIVGDGEPTGSADADSQPLLTVGSANFPENELLAQIYAAALTGAGLEVHTAFNLGSREVVFPALESGDVTVVPEYTGALLTYIAKGSHESTSTEEQIAALESMLPEGLQLLEPSTAQDQETVTCTREVAEQHDLTSLDDLAPVSDQLVFGGPPELPQRDGFGLRGLKEVYGVEFDRFQPLDVSGPLTVAALKDQKVDCANLFSTASAITTNGFVSLTDPRGLIESEAVVPLIVTNSATPDVVRTLDAVSAELTTDRLKEMVARVEVDKESSAAVAQEFLADHGLAGAS